MRLNSSKKILVLTGIGFLIILVLDIVFIQAVSSRIVGIHHKGVQLDLSSTEREKDLAVKDAIRDSESDRVSLGSYFVGGTDAETALFIGSIETLAAQNGLEIDVKSVNYEPISAVKVSDQFSFIRLKVGVVGSWGEVFTFLKTIETLEKVVTVNGAVLQFDAEAKTWLGDIDFSVVKINN